MGRYKEHSAAIIDSMRTVIIGLLPQADIQTHVAVHVLLLQVRAGLPQAGTSWAQPYEPLL